VGLKAPFTSMQFKVQLVSEVSACGPALVEPA
jgi:hypothetical protein